MPPSFVLWQIFSHAGECVASGQEYNSRACKYVLNFMANIFNLAHLAGVRKMDTSSALPH
jgi:hypothetical protein